MSRYNSTRDETKQLRTEGQIVRVKNASLQERRKQNKINIKMKLSISPPLLMRFNFI